MTFWQIIQNAVQDGLGLPRDPIAVDIRDLALSSANNRGKIIWSSWPFDNEKMDEFTAPTPSAQSGVIVFSADVDAIRAVKVVPAGATEGTRIWSEDELNAAAQGGAVSSERFIYLSDYQGCRRIKVADPTLTYRVLALSKWVDAIVDPLYSPATPSATPTDYRVLTFPLDRAEPALLEMVKDDLRVWDGNAPKGEGISLMQLAKNRETEQQDRDQRLNPRYPAYSEVGDW
jgi:hypothetical protein